MSRRFLSGIMVVVLLVSVLMLAFRVQRVEAMGPVIYIMSDGSVVPPTAPISTADEVTFTLTSNITYPTYYGVVAQRNNIVIDGVGYSLTSNQSGIGLNVTSVNNVTIKNLKVLSFNIGILLNASSNDYVTGTSLDGNAANGIYLVNTLSSNITQNTLTNNWQPIHLEFSHNNRVTDNSVTDNTFGIYTYSSTNNLVFRNNVTKSRGTSGIYVYSGGNNNLTGNRLADNLYAGVEMSTSSMNIMLGNNISNNTYGIKLGSGSNNTSMVGNDVSSNWLGFRQDDSSNSFLRNNVINGNNYSFSIAGSQLSSFINDVNASNTIDGKPIIYLINQTNCAVNPTTYPSIGYLAVVNSTSVTAESFSMNRSYEGVLLACTNNSFVKNVTVSNSQSGIVFAGSSRNNTVSSSTLVANNIGVLCSSNSTISNCNFTSNNQGVQLSSNNTIIVGNSMTNNSNYGVYGSSYSANVMFNDIIAGNNITANTGTGIAFSNPVSTPSNSSITDNSITGGKSGIEIYVSNSTISRNNVTGSSQNGISVNGYSNNITGNRVTTANQTGITIGSASNTTLTSNVMIGNANNLYIYGSGLQDFIIDIGTSNTVDGKPVYYLKNQKDLAINPTTYPNIGYLGVVNSTNVTIKNLDLRNNGQGILSAYCNNSVIQKAGLTNNTYGVHLLYCSNITVSNNSIASNMTFRPAYGILLSASSNMMSSNNSISHNTVTGAGAAGPGSQTGIEVDCANNSLLVDNWVNGNNESGIKIQYSNNISLFSNHLVKNGYGISVQAFSNGTLRNNVMTDNLYNLYIEGNVISQFLIDIDTSNTVNGKPVIYLTNQSNLQINPTSYPSVGFLGVVNSVNMTIKDLTLENNGEGLLLAYTNNSLVQNNSIVGNLYGIYLPIHSDGNRMVANNISGNLMGVWLGYTSNNKVARNTLASNQLGITLETASNSLIAGNDLQNNYVGFYVDYSTNNKITENNVTGSRTALELEESTDNRIFHNNFVGNYRDLFTYGYNYDNSWDNGYPSGGNYWSDYNGTDLYSGVYQNVTGSDGIGDTPFLTDPTGYPSKNDAYPLMQPYNSGPVLNVDTEETFWTIQSAINSSDTLNGHTILVQNGTYHENVIVDKSISLLGENMETTIIDGNTTNPVVQIDSNLVTISGFTVQNGTYGILANLTSSCTISGNKVKANQFGVNVYFSTNNTVVGNNVTTNAYDGIFLVTVSGNNTISGNTVSANGRHGVVLWDRCNNNTVNGNNISNNLVNGLMLYYSSNNTVTGNSLTTNSRGIVLDSSSNTNSIFHNNFVQNMAQASIHSSCLSNAWDNGYPSGGNYWSNYTGVDFKSGPNQDQLGSDGIGDTNHTINADNVDHYPLMNPFIGIHEVGIANVTTCKTGCLPEPSVSQGYDVDVTVKVSNYGISAETFSLTIYANNIPLKTLSITLPARSSTTIVFTWNTTGFAKGDYTISAYATPVTGETNTTDNTFVGGNLKVTLVGDVNCDDYVGIDDIFNIALHFGQDPTNPLWNPNCDINNDLYIGIDDIFTAALHFGEGE